MSKETDSFEARRREVLQLLKDYNQKYPSGGDIHEWMAAAAFDPGDWPLTSEGLKRMGVPAEGQEEPSFTTVLIHETYLSLDKALTALRSVHPIAYRSISYFYLDPDASPSLLTWTRKLAEGGNLEAYAMTNQHDLGVDYLAGLLEDTDLYVRWPETYVKETEERSVEGNDEVAAMVLREVEAGIAVTKAVQIVAVKKQISEATIWRVLRVRGQS